MSQHISRRRLLRSAIKSGVGFAVLRQLNVAPVRVLASCQPKTDRADTDFRPAFARLDDFIAGHMRDVGAPRMTLALANREGLLRTSRSEERRVGKECRSWW